MHCYTRLYSRLHIWLGTEHRHHVTVLDIEHETDIHTLALLANQRVTDMMASHIPA
jgi:hypothetical protein